jgi:hypothetical protein
MAVWLSSTARTVRSVSVDAYLDAIGRAMANAGDIVPWPLHLAQIGPYYGDIEGADLYTRLRAFEAAGASDEDIARLFPSASSAKSLLMDLVCGLKDAAVPAADRTWFVGRMLAAIGTAETGDIFCRDGAHRLLTESAATALVEGAGWSECSQPAGKAAFSLSGAAQALIWSQHFYGWTDIGFVIHGPYRVALPDGRPGQLVVRDFFDLLAADVWPQLPPLPVRRLQVSSLHDLSDRFEVDIFNHLLHARAQADSCVAVRVTADDRPIAPDAMNDLRKLCLDRVRHQQGDIERMDEPQVLTKFIESRYYALRGWRGADWRPPAEVLTRIKERPLVPPPPAAGWPTLRMLFDPRVD